MSPEMSPKSSATFEKRVPDDHIASYWWRSEYAARGIAITFFYNEQQPF